MNLVADIWGGLIGVLLLVGLLRCSIRLVKEDRRLIVFRLGRCLGAKGPGWVFLIPLVDIPVWVELGEQILRLPGQTCVTQDDMTISFNCLVHHRVVDPVKAVLGARDSEGGVQTNIAVQALREVVKEFRTDDVLVFPRYLADALKIKLQEAMRDWGIKIISVELENLHKFSSVQRGK